MNLIKQLQQHIPNLGTFLKGLIPNKDLIINRQLSLHPNSLSLISKQRIPKNNFLFLISGRCLLCSTKFSGATLQQQFRINEKLRQIQQLIPTLDPDRLRFIIQLMALKRNQKSQPIHHYISDITKPELMQAAIQKICAIPDGITETHFAGFFQSQIAQIFGLFETLKAANLKGFDIQQFLPAFQIVKENSRVCTNYGNIICPLVNLIEHSNKPNCELVGLYLTFHRQSFLAVKSITDIPPQTQLSIQYGPYGNFELITRYGLISKDNPYDQVYIPLDYELKPDIITENIKMKEILLQKQGLSLKNIVKVRSRGLELHPDDLAFLKIIFSSYQNQIQLNQQKLDQKIWHFITLNVQKILPRYKAQFNNISNPMIAQYAHKEISTMQEIMKKHY